MLLRISLRYGCVETTILGEKVDQGTLKRKKTGACSKLNNNF